ncbi:hypothetical protein MesoLj131b_06960 [Mesorhizobium sp. 131-2-5]|nr:hypothetical protein MesoLj131b_06960 [Mesorhizobium sp. 131-2-5]
MTSNLTKDNHYVSQGYLKQWECTSGEIFVHLRLVSHENVPLWEKKTIKGIAYREHLYTRQIAGSDNDEIERWFSREFETPAEDAIQRVLNGDRIASEHWHKLVQFLAMHDVRTPARLLEYLESAADNTSKALAEILGKLPEELAEMKRNGVAHPTPDAQKNLFPLRVTTEIKDGEKFGTLKAETAVGRASWLWGMQHLLNNTAKVFHQHKWTIMHPAKGMTWFTTDKPVIRLNYYKPGNYDFKGGWGRTGGEILFPLSPEHLLYTQIGSRPPARGTRFSPEQTQLLRRLIAEHAHRYIFAKAEDPDIPAFVERTVNAEVYKHEQDQWNKWHAEQLESERYLFRDKEAV